MVKKLVEMFVALVDVLMAEVMVAVVEFQRSLVELHQCYSEGEVAAWMVAASKVHSAQSVP